MQRNLYEVRAFTRDPDQGNPAGVLTDATGLTDEQMQKIAADVGHSETAFIMPALIEGDKKIIPVRFFTPTTEVPVCGHATISAHYVRAIEGALGTSTVIQRSKAYDSQIRTILGSDRDYRVSMEQGEIQFGSVITGIQKQTLIDALGVTEDDLVSGMPAQIVSTGHSKVMIPLNERSVLNNLNPNLEALKKLSAQIGCNGFFVFTRDSEMPGILTEGRMFAPAIGINEDPVTGNAHGPLGAYLAYHRSVRPTDKSFIFKGRQGVAMGKPGIVEVQIDILGAWPTKATIGGEAVIKSKRVIDI